MVIEYVPAAVGLALIVASGLWFRKLKSRMDRVIHTGGLTIDQVRDLRRHLRGGKLPADPLLYDAGIAYARQADVNIPIRLRANIPLYLGVILLASALYPASALAWTALGAQIAYAAVALFSVISSLLLLNGSRDVLAALHPTPAIAENDAPARDRGPS